MGDFILSLLSKALFKMKWAFTLTLEMDMCRWLRAVWSCWIVREYRWSEWCVLSFWVHHLKHWHPGCRDFTDPVYNACACSAMCYSSTHFYKINSFSIKVTFIVDVCISSTLNMLQLRPYAQLITFQLQVYSFIWPSWKNGLHMKRVNRYNHHLRLLFSNV